jgi:hypothetical protein
MATMEEGGPALHTKNHYDRTYAFYQELERQERQERQPKLVWLIVLCSSLVALSVAIWTMHRPVTWTTVTTPFELTR